MSKELFKILSTWIFALAMSWIILVSAVYGAFHFANNKRLEPKLAEKKIIIENYQKHERRLLNEIADIKLSLRWEHLLKILLTRDRKDEFDKIENYLKTEVPDGLLRVDMSELEKINK